MDAWPEQENRGTSATSSWPEDRLAPSLSRRRLLTRCGLLGAGLAAASLPLSAVRAGAAPDLPLEAANGALHLLARDTVAGLAVLAVPGQDRYSVAQGETSPTPGAIDAKGDELLLEALDDFLPLPDGYVRTLAAALSTAVDDVQLPEGTLDGLLGAATEPLTATMDDALRTVLAHNETVPLSLLISLLLNYEATGVRPAAVRGPFPAAPFANLDVAGKAEVFRRIENAHAELVRLLDRNAPQPLQGSVSGLLEYVGGTLLEFAAFVPYCEYGVFDRSTRRATRRPVGWELSAYMPGRHLPVDGWDEFLGYYEGRRSASTAPEYANG